MKQTRIIMCMPVTLEALDPGVTVNTFDAVFAYFEYVDRKFSTYKPDSEISLINRQEITLAQSSEDMQAIFSLAEQTRLETGGYFDISRKGLYDPSGIVKGWAIFTASEMLRQAGFKNYYVDAGGDIQVSGKNAQGQDCHRGPCFPTGCHRCGSREMNSIVAAIPSAVARPKSQANVVSSSTGLVNPPSTFSMVPTISR